MQFSYLSVIFLTTLTSAQPISHLRSRQYPAVDQVADTVSDAATPAAGLLQILSPQARLKAQCAQNFPGLEFVEYNIFPNEKNVPIECKQASGEIKKIEASDPGTPCTWIGPCDKPESKVTGRSMAGTCSPTFG